MDSEFVDKYLSGGQGAAPASPAKGDAPGSSAASADGHHDSPQLADAAAAMNGWLGFAGPQAFDRLAAGASSHDATEVTGRVGHATNAQPTPPAGSPSQPFLGAPLNQGQPPQPVAGAPATFTYRFHVEDLIKPRREPPEIGWRKVVYAVSFRTINLGPSLSEQHLRQKRAMIEGRIPGNYQIPVLSIKGGVGKTSTVAGVGTVFAKYRTEPVIAIDANPCYGTLGRLVDPRDTASIREWLADDTLRTYPKARTYTGMNKQGLEVLAGNQNVANPLSLDADTITATLKGSQQFYQLALIDCGSMIDHPVTPGILASASALVIVSSLQVEHIEKAGQTIEWLAANGAHHLLQRTVLVLNDAFHSHKKKFVAQIIERVEPYVQAVNVIPFDKHLRDGVTLDFDALRRRTQLAYLELAAELATGFGTAPVNGMGMAPIAAVGR